MFGHKIKIDDDLFEKLKKCSDAAGYSSPAEFALHVLEKETTRILGSGGAGTESEEELRKRLEGLGYIE
jgi:predicted CopG family antitoxin